jgi:hypothetical protein
MPYQRILTRKRCRRQVFRDLSVLRHLIYRKDTSLKEAPEEQTLNQVSFLRLSDLRYFTWCQHALSGDVSKEQAASKVSVCLYTVSSLSHLMPAHFV